MWMSLQLRAPDGMHLARGIHSRIFPIAKARLLDKGVVKEMSRDADLFLMNYLDQIELGDPNLHPEQL